MDDGSRIRGISQQLRMMSDTYFYIGTLNLDAGMEFRELTSLRAAQSNIMLLSIEFGIKALYLRAIPVNSSENPLNFKNEMIASGHNIFKLLNTLLPKTDVESRNEIVDFVCTRLAIEKREFDSELEKLFDAYTTERYFIDPLFEVATSSIRIPCTRKFDDILATAVHEIADRKIRRVGEP